MALTSRLVKPAHQDLTHLTVLRTERLSPHWMRVTLGGGEIEKFRPMGYDQWFRIFLPLGGEEGLERIPAKAQKIFGYLKYLRIPDGIRPVMRNYSVRAYRPAGGGRDAEIDVDFVLHGSAADGTAGPASRWAETCEPGESVVIIDEGLAFHPGRGTDRVLLVSDETGLPAIAGICASLDPEASGLAIIEVPDERDALEFDHPAGIDVRWIVRAHDAKARCFGASRAACPVIRRAPRRRPAPLHRRRAGPPHRGPAPPRRRPWHREGADQLVRLLARRRGIADAKGAARGCAGPRMSRVSTAFLLTCAAIGVAGGVLLAIATWVSTALFAAAPFASVAIAGLWLLPATVALRLLQRPGAGLLVGLISGLVCIPFSPTGAYIVFTNVWWAFFAEVAFLVVLYRFWTTWQHYAGALLVGIVYPSLAWVSFDLGSFTLGAQIGFYALTTASALAGTWLGILVADRLRDSGVARLARRRPHVAAPAPDPLPEAPAA